MTKSTLLDKVDEPQTAALVAPTSDAGMVALIERLASNPAVDVDKLRALLDMNERVIDRNAKSAFDAAFAKMQPDLPEITERGRIEVKGQLRSTFAKLEDIQKAIKPVLKTHGFAIRHRTEWPENSKTIRIVGILSHEQGHSEESTFEAPMDKSEYRTDIQSQGSTISYGRRYTTLDLLNITTRGADDDGKSSGRPTPPDGYDAWFAVLEGLTGRDFSDAWDRSDIKFRNFAVQSDKDRYAAVRAKQRGGRG